jgi:hypothetical protein
MDEQNYVCILVGPVFTVMSPNQLTGPPYFKSRKLRTKRKGNILDIKFLNLYA